MLNRYYLYGRQMTNMTVLIRMLLRFALLGIMIGICHGDDLRQTVQDVLKGRKLRVVTIGFDPYTTYTPDGGYVGYIPDMLSLMSKRLGFQYEIYKSPDGRWGAYDEQTGKWNGMVGEIKKFEKTNGAEGADMTAAPLTMTRLREAHVDFIKPFQHVGLTLVTKRPSPGLGLRHFSVISPLSPAVWAVIAAATLVAGVGLWGVYKILGIAGVVEDQQQFGLAGSLLFVFTSLQWQGYVRTPRPIGARILTCTWFAFVTLTLVTYVGGLVYHFDWATRGYLGSFSPLGVQRLADVVSDRRWTYGCMKGGSTERFVRSANMDVYKSMSEFWDSPRGNTSMVQSMEEGIQKIRTREHYALILETMIARHLVNTECDLVTVGEMFAQRSYGLAIPTGHPLEEVFHRAVLELMEAGDLEALEKIWWTGAGKCWREEAASTFTGVVPSKQADMEMMAVPFGMIAVGILLAFLLTGLDILLFKYRGKGLSGGTFAMRSPDDSQEGIM